MMTNDDNPLVEKDPQDQQTVGPTVPKEPGEIGWHADASEPGDFSTPAPGSGGVGPYEPPEPTPPTLAEDVAVDVSVEPEPVAEPEVAPKPQPDYVVPENHEE